MASRTEFFKELYGFCEGLIELRTFKPFSQQFFKTDDQAGIGKFCGAHKDSDIYFGVGTRDGRDHNGTRGGKSNIVHIPAVWCDIDYKETPRARAVELYKKFPFDPTAIVFTGGGVHLYWALKEPAIKDDLEVIKDVNRRIATYLEADAGSTDAARVLRVPNTFNQKYSPPAEVRVKKLNGFRYELRDFLEVIPPVEQHKKHQEKKTESPGWLTELMAGVDQGNRDDAGARIAGYFINKLPSKDVLAILRAWNKLNRPPLPDADIKRIVTSIRRYKDTANTHGVAVEHVYDSARMIKAYQEHIRSLKQNQFKTGIIQIDDRIRGVAGGEVLTLIARSGSFKTTALQNMMLNFNQTSGLAACFFSIEMPVATLTERYFAMLDGCTAREVESLYLDPTLGDVCRAAEGEFIKDLKRLYIIDATVSVGDIERYVQLIENQFNVKTGVIGIDYLGLIEGPGRSNYEIVSKVAKDVKILAKRMNLPVVMLCQTSRRAGDGEKEISLDMARDSGAVEESADFIFGLYQVESKTPMLIGGDEIQYNLVCKILKNRKGLRKSRWILDLNPRTFRIGPEAEKYTPEESRKGF